MKTNSISLSLRSVSWIAVVIALLSSYPIARANNLRLVAIPVVFGIVLVAICDWLIQGRGSVDSIRASRSEIVKVGSCPEMENFIDYKRMLPSKRAISITSQQNIIEQIRRATETAVKYLILGQTGSGKTTLLQEFCRNMSHLEIGQKARKIPILLQFSQSPPRSNGVLSLCVDMIAEKFKDVAVDKRGLAKRLLNEGSLCLLLDDLEFLNQQDLAELDGLAKKHKENSFICVASQARSSHFFQDFEKITVPSWTSADVVEYVRGKLPEVDAKKLIDHLNKWDELKTERTVFQWKYIVELAEEGRLYEELYPNKLKNKTDYEVLNDYLSIVLGGGEQYANFIKELGKLSLRLLIMNRKTFTLDQSEVRTLKLPLEAIAPKLFQNSDGVFTIHGTQQVFMASKYLADHWPEAKLELRDSKATELVWTPVYVCTREMMTRSDYREEFKDSFATLGQMARATRPS